MTGRPADPARAVARALLYEGYVLWPYRRSALKNQRRWTFGGVHPRAWSEDGHEDDRWTLLTECLVEAREGSPVASPAVGVAVRFLQVVERRVARVSDGRLDFADEVEVGGERHLAWDEAREREVRVPPLHLEAGSERRVPIALYAASRRAWLEDASGARAGAVVRTWRGLAGEVVVGSEPLGAGRHRLRVRVSNTTPWTGEGREDALRSTFASTHVVLSASGAEFVSLTDPPPELAAEAEACRNDGWWPVLVGEPGARHTMLASPIIVPDYPAVAPESPGDLFDGGEIDELLTLHILALTDEEKEEMRAADPRTRHMLERTSGLGREEILGLHGTFRDPDGPPSAAPAGGDGPGARIDSAPDDGVADGLADGAPDPFWTEMGRPASGRVVVEGVTLTRGSRVRLRPRPGGDVMDLALAGRTAVIEGIDEDETGGVHLSVAVEGDPGRDLGMARHPGHRFFFRPEEVEPLPEAPEVAAGDPADEAPELAPVDPLGEVPEARGEPSILVAGIGNIFLGDDGFGVEVANRLLDRPLPGNVTVEDFGIRGMDLAYSLRDYDVAIFVDAVPRDGEPGTLYVIEAPTEEGGPVAVETHGMDPARVLAFARALGPLPDRVYVVGCEPAVVPDPAADEIVGELSEPVRAAVEGAVAEVETLLSELTGGTRGHGRGPRDGKRIDGARTRR